jgi:methionyl aminopeptidase
MVGSRRGIILKSPREIELMRCANQHLAEILEMMCEAAQPGVSTWELDRIARAEIDKRPVESAFLGYGGYPAVVCTSVNEVIVHGIPRKDVVLSDGDIIGIDFGVVYKGYVGDSARTIAVGEVADDVQALMDCTERALEKAIELCTPEYRLSDIGRVVEGEARELGYGVVRDFVGHGIGLRMHEEPQVPNYFDGPKPRMRPGLVIAIEPMFNMGTHEVEVLDDEWTAVTQDGLWAAHFEHSIAITENGPDVLSRLSA